MAKKIRSESGVIYCSYCGTAVVEEDLECSNCGETLEEDVHEGRVCHSCGTPVGKLEEFCPTCGVNLSGEDDEYLSRLLGWGDEAEEKLKSKVEEKRKAADVFRKVLTGAKSEDPEDDLDQPKDDISFNQLYGFVERREERLAKEMEEADDDQKEVIQSELDRLDSFKEHIFEIESAVNALMEDKERELNQKREELNERVREFKKVIKNKENEKIKIQDQKDKIQEKEAELKQWETQLRSWEEDLRELESSLMSEKKMYENGEKKLEEIEEGIPKEGTVTPEEWMAEQKRIQRELFKLKDVWDEDDTDLEDISGDSISILKKKIQKKEEEWKERVSELEQELKNVKDEKESIGEKGLEIDVKREELEKILVVLDRLLGDLPDDKIEEFANSDDFDLYEKIMDILGI